jgi:hypothetical protein
MEEIKMRFLGEEPQGNACLGTYSGKAARLKTFVNRDTASGDKTA